MTNDQTDPWKSLANELGVDAREEPTPPPAASPPPTVKRTTPPTATPPAAPKNKPADWRSLAGELGIEVPPEPEMPPLKAPDPVAEILGFSQPPAHPPEANDDKTRSGRPQEYPDSYSADDRWEVEEGDMAFRDVEDKDTGRSDERGEGRRFHGEKPAEGDRPPRRRRGRRGRGRGEGRGEPRERLPRDQGAAADQRRTDRRDTPADQPSERPPTAEPAAAAGETTERGEPRRDRGRRRGRRRGKAAPRDRSDVRPVGRDELEAGKPPSAENEPDDDLDLDYASSELDGADTLEAAGVAAGGESGSEMTADAEEHTGRNSVRDILTWQEAIGMIIEVNLQSRAKSPQTSHAPRGSRGRGRGRGRGRDGHRGG